jgi:hypothetical protein
MAPFPTEPGHQYPEIWNAVDLYNIQIGGPDEHPTQWREQAQVAGR